MDVPISLGQGLGLAAACGLVALVPLLIGALAAAAGALPGALGSYDDTAVIAGSAVAAIANVGASPFITGPLRLVLAAIGGGAVCEFTAGDSIAIAPIAIGAVMGAVAAFGAGTVVDGARAGGGTTGGVTALATATCVLIAGLALIPFVGYLIGAAAIWLAVRVRRRRDQKFAGLRVLR
jgi:hypothetical protein